MKIAEKPFDFSSLLKKKKKKEEPSDTEEKIEIPPGLEEKIPIPEEFIPEIIQTIKPKEAISRSVVPKTIKEHPLVQDFTRMMDNEVEKTRLGEEIIEKIESLETNYDLEFMQKLITIKNVLNYTQSSWSFGVCKELLDGISIRGSRKQIATGLIKTIKKMAKLR